MAEIGRSLLCAVVAQTKEEFVSNPFVSFQQFQDATSVVDSAQEYLMYPIWPEQRQLAVAFDAVFFLVSDGGDTFINQHQSLLPVCHRYAVNVGAIKVSELFEVTFRPTVFRSLEECTAWKQLLVTDFKALSAKLLEFHKLFDSDNTGAFTVNTFSSKMTEAVESFGSSMLQQLYEDIDRHRDFKIDVEELESWWRKGRKGNSRKLITAAVEKWMPGEHLLRDFDAGRFPVEIDIRTEDSLEKLIKIELRYQQSPPQDLLPHIEKLQPNHWGVLLDTADDRLSTILRTIGLSEHSVGPSTVFTAPYPTKLKSKWPFYHFTLESASPFLLGNKTIVFQSPFTAFTFNGLSLAKESDRLKTKIAGRTGLTNEEIEAGDSHIPKELSRVATALRDFLTNLNSHISAVRDVAKSGLRKFTLFLHATEGTWLVSIQVLSVHGLFIVD